MPEGSEDVEGADVPAKGSGEAVREAATMTAVMW